MAHAQSAKDRARRASRRTATPPRSRPRLDRPGDTGDVSAGPPPPAPDSPEADVKPTANAASRPDSHVPWLVARSDRVLIAVGMAGLLVTLGLVAWERGSPGTAPSVSGRSWLLVSALGTFFVWAVYLFWKVPSWQAASRRGAAGVGAKELFDIENAARGTLGQILGGLAVIAGLVFAWQQLGSTAKTLQVNQDGEITSRYSSAVTQLGSDELTVRLGGIYALERIARDSRPDYWPVMEVLTSFVRQNAPLPGGATPAATPTVATHGPPVDVQAVLTVLGRRNTKWDEAGCLDLTHTNLAYAVLSGANLVHICLGNADLTGANLLGADLSGDSLDGANLTSASLGSADLARASLTNVQATGADLTSANLTHANLQGAALNPAVLQKATLVDASLIIANLSNAVMFGADLSGANLAQANLNGALLVGANLATAQYLTPAQIASAVIDQTTKLPPRDRASPRP